MAGEGIISTAPTASPQTVPNQAPAVAQPPPIQGGVVSQPQQQTKPQPQVPMEFSDDMIRSLTSLGTAAAMSGDEDLIKSIKYSVEMLKTDSYTGRFEAGSNLMINLRSSGAGPKALDMAGLKYSKEFLGLDYNAFEAAPPGKATMKVKRKGIVDGVDTEYDSEVAAGSEPPLSPKPDKREKGRPAEITVKGVTYSILRDPETNEEIEGSRQVKEVKKTGSTGNKNASFDSFDKSRKELNALYGLKKDEKGEESVAPTARSDYFGSVGQNYVDEAVNYYKSNNKPIPKDVLTHITQITTGKDKWTPQDAANVANKLTSMGVKVGVGRQSSGKQQKKKKK